jgi:hypothetical protein
MAHTLAQAAIATGRDRSTLLKAIKAGKLSATRDSATDAWRVDPAELARVYGIGYGKDSALLAPGRYASRTDCCRSVSDFRR